MFSLSAYKIKFRGKILEEGFKNNFKLKSMYYLSGIPNKKGFQTGFETIQYQKPKAFKDTFEMLKYDLSRSLVEGLKKEYYTNSQLKSKCIYHITTDK